MVPSIRNATRCSATYFIIFWLASTALRLFIDHDLHLDAAVMGGDKRPANIRRLKGSNHLGKVCA